MTNNLLLYRSAHPIDKSAIAQAIFKLNPHTQMLVFWWLGISAAPLHTCCTLSAGYQPPSSYQG
ncbi:hypothetical protein [Microcoleus sp. S13_C5]|uniref:hypothetical protein n=1 Tax=Microcoleus sp. S13_C5 TaxID=3055411 RepID=UPI002FCEF175